MAKTGRRAKLLEKERYGNWLVLPNPKVKKGDLIYKVKCDCGYRTELKAAILRGGYSEKCIKCRTDNQRGLDGSPAKRVFFYYYKYAAKRRHISWKLSRKRFYELVVKNCDYCGSAPRPRQVNVFVNLPMNGVDRKDSSKGYSFENCGTCCTECNSFKGILTVDKFLDHVCKIFEYQRRK